MYELQYSKIIISEAYYRSVRFIIICPCCGTALRLSPTSKRDKERLRQLKVTEEEQENIETDSSGTTITSPEQC